MEYRKEEYTELQPIQDDLTAEMEVLAESGALDQTQLMAALLEACGTKPKEISRRLGMGPQYVYNLRASTENYKMVVRRLQGIIASRMVAQSSDATTLFNQQIGPSAATLISIRDDFFAKDGDRIKAAQIFIDRAPDAPKPTQHVESRNQHIVIPVNTMQEMRKALMEDGETESLKVIKTMDVLELEANNPPAPDSTPAPAPSPPSTYIPVTNVDDWGDDED